MTFFQHLRVSTITDEECGVAFAVQDADKFRKPGVECRLPGERDRDMLRVECFPPPLFCYRVLKYCIVTGERFLLIPMHPGKDRLRWTLL